MSVFLKFSIFFSLIGDFVVNMQTINNKYITCSFDLILVAQTQINAMRLKQVSLLLACDYNKKHLYCTSQKTHRYKMVPLSK